MLSKISETSLGDVTLYAKWDKESWHIKLDPAGGEVEEGFVLSFRNADENSLGTIKEECVKKDDKSKNQFLLKLTNDFKSPLQSIVGFSQAMSDGLGGAMTEQQDKYIKIINKNSSELMYFITKLMELTQTEIEDKSPEYKIFDIISTINTVVKFNEQLYKDKDAIYYFDPPYLITQAPYNAFWNEKDEIDLLNLFST